MKKLAIVFLIFQVIFSACSMPAVTQNISPTSDKVPGETVTALPQPSRTPTLPLAVTSTPLGCQKIALAMFNFHKKEQPDIYTVCPNGSQLTRLTDNPAVDIYPVWLPDGECLAFVSDRSGRNQIYLMEADGSHVTQMTIDYDNTNPVWLPDGLRIAFRT